VAEKWAEVALLRAWALLLASSWSSPPACPVLRGASVDSSNSGFSPVGDRNPCPLPPRGATLSLFLPLSLSLPLFPSLFLTLGAPARCRAGGEQRRGRGTQEPPPPRGHHTLHHTPYNTLICIYTYIYMCTYIYLYVYTHILYVYMYIYIYRGTCAVPGGRRGATRTRHSRAYAVMFICLFYVYMYILYVYMFICIYTCAVPGGWRGATRHSRASASPRPPPRPRAGPRAPPRPPLPVPTSQQHVCAWRERQRHKQQNSRGRYRRVQT